MSYTRDPLTPMMVNKYIKNNLENDNFLKQLYITGELSNVKYHTNGNIYFSIKDESAQINCIMFKNYKIQLQEEFIEGDKVEILGSLYTYIKMGQYSINTIKMRKIGLGDLFQKYLELKKELELKGYFAESNKKEIPQFPQKIGVITSSTGAAVRDVITTIKRRYKLAKIVIIPTLVQGKEAYKDITKNIERANSIEDFDVLIVGRGGGSIEDLWAFNEVEVAQAIYQSKIPIISAVGHETDFTIADFVADKRAPTPTGAAEIATPNIEILQKNLQKNIEGIRKNIEIKIKMGKEKLKYISNNQYFKNPLLNIQTSFDYLTQKVFSETKLFQKKIGYYQSEINNLQVINFNNIKNVLERKKNKLEHQKENLDNLNPLSILSKGYGVVKKENEFIKSIKQVKLNDEIEINLKDGDIKTKIMKIKEKNAKK